MKSCPKCNRSFDSSLDFCLEDGTRLASLPSGNAAVTADARPAATVVETVQFPLEAQKSPAYPGNTVEVETVVAKADVLLPIVSSRGHGILEYASIIIALAHNWWQWLYLEKQYVSSVMDYVLSANFLMWLLLLVAGTTVSLIAIRQSGKRVYSFVSLVVLAINLILFLVPRR